MTRRKKKAEHQAWVTTIYKKQAERDTEETTMYKNQVEPHNWDSKLKAKEIWYGYEITHLSPKQNGGKKSSKADMLAKTNNKGGSKVLVGNV